MFRKKATHPTNTTHPEIMGPRRNPNIKENLDCTQALYQAARFTFNPTAHDEDAIKAESIAATQCFNEIFRKKNGC